jgi:hypothetical protein
MSDQFTLPHLLGLVLIATSLLHKRLHRDLVANHPPPNPIPQTPPLLYLTRLRYGYFSLHNIERALMKSPVNSLFIIKYNMGNRTTCHKNLCVSVTLIFLGTTACPISQNWKSQSFNAPPNTSTHCSIIYDHLELPCAKQHCFLAKQSI